MKAVVYHTYGAPDVLQYADVPTPQPKPDQVRVKIQAASVGYGDLSGRNFKNLSPSEFNMPAILWLLARVAMGLNKPANPILGAEFAGVVDAVGDQVTRFKVGDAVFGYRGSSFGTYAEYVCIAERGLIAPLPANMTSTDAAAVSYGALTALNLLRTRNIQRGQQVLIVGASGSIGSAAVQLAKHWGAEVTAVCSAEGAAYVRLLGADHVIDYKRADFTESGKTYDLIFDVLGRSTFAKSKKALKSDGCYLRASFKMRELFQMLWTKLTDADKRVICTLSMESRDDLQEIKALIETGALKSIVDKTYPLAQAAAAHRYAESTPKQGGVVLVV